ncbi:MAG: WXG100 family type VII secretion target [Chloroflexota bacterium]
MDRKPVKIDYQEILQAFIRLSRLAEQAHDVHRNLQNNREALDGEWIGLGSKKFFGEMDDYVLPSVKKLEEALQNSAKLIADISRQLSDLEQAESAYIEAFLLAASSQADFTPTPTSPVLNPPSDGLLYLDEGLSLPKPTATLFGKDGFTLISLEYGENGILGHTPDGVDLIPNAATSDAETIGQPVNALYSGILFVDPIDPHRAYLIPDVNPDLTITYAHISTAHLPLDPESGTLMVEAGDSVGAVMDISHDPMGTYPEGTPNHLHLSINARGIDPETGSQKIFDIKQILGLA